MNEIKAQDAAVQSAKSLSPLPQVSVSHNQSHQDDEQRVAAQAKAEKTANDVGKILPIDEPNKAAKAVKDAEVEDAVSKLNEYLQKTQRNLDFHLDEDSGKTVIRVYDRSSDMLVRQIPNEVALELAKKLNSEEPALLFSAQV